MPAIAMPTKSADSKPDAAKTPAAPETTPTGNTTATPAAKAETKPAAKAKSKAKASPPLPGGPVNSMAWANVPLAECSASRAARTS